MRENDNFLDRIQYFEPAEKEALKGIDIGGGINKRSISDIEQKNLVYDFIRKAEKKFGYKNIAITQYNDEDVYLNPMEIVMVMTFNKTYLKIDDDNSIKAVKDRKIIFTNREMILTNTSDNSALNDYLNIRRDHSFVMANENCLINLHHALNIIHIDRYYYFTMQTSLIKQHLEFFTKGLGKEDRTNIGKLGPKYRPYYTLEALPNHNIIKLSDKEQTKNKEYHQLIANNLRL